MAYVKTKIISAAATGGTQTFQDPSTAWTPSAALFFVSAAAAADTPTAPAKLCIGAATGSSEQWCASIRSADNVGTMDTERLMLVDACMVLINNGAASEEISASFSSFGEGSVTVIWSGTPANAYVVTVVLFYCKFALASTYTMSGSINGLTSVTVGFEPTVIIGGYASAAAGSVSSPAMLSIGVSYNDTFPVQYSHSIQDADGVGTSFTVGHLSGTYFAFTAGGSGVVDKASEITAFNSTGFQARQRLASGSAELVGYLALYLDDSRVVGGKLRNMSPSVT